MVLLRPAVAGETVRVGAYDNPPGVFFDAKGDARGFFVDLLQEIAKEEDWSLSFVHTPRAEAGLRLRDGSIDLLLGVMREDGAESNSTAALAYNTEPLLAMWNEVIVRDESTIDTLFDLKNKKIAVVKGDVNVGEFMRSLDAYEIPCTFVLQPDTMGVVLSVENNEADAGVLSGTPGSAMATNPFLRRTGIVSNPIRLYCATVKGRQDLLQSLDSRLSQWKREPDSIYHEGLRKWLGQDFGPPPGGMPPHILSMVAVLVGLLLVSFLLVITLRRKVRQSSRELELSYETLHESESRFETYVENAPDGIVIFDDAFKVLDVNMPACLALGYSRAELLALNGAALVAEQERYLIDAHFAALQHESEIEFESRMRRKDGSEFPVMIKIVRLRNSCNMGFFADISERKRLENHLRQAEKMEAIGQLAGGIAHDFNNQLSGIMGYGGMLVEKIDDPALKRYAEVIVRSANRASDLTKQLLAFARKGQYQCVPIDLHALVNEVTLILRHTIDRRIEVKEILNARPSVMMGDPTQIQNAVLNLSLNARDAMPDGGTLTLQVEAVELDAAYCKAITYHIEPGHYLCVSVTDSGTGMDAETQEHIFEPFFTTKEVGKGTGMGLAAVFGTVKQHSGAINVYSELGFGTTFRLYFPLADTPGMAESMCAEKPPACKPGQVLVIDDEKVFCSMAREMLSQYGHKVVGYYGGAEGLEYYGEHWREVDVVILDLIMPQMDGREVFARIREINPGAKVVIASGYSLGSVAQRLLEEGACGFIQKPFSHLALAKIVAESMQND